MFSDEVNEAPREFINLKNVNFESYFEYIEENLKLANRCLKTVVAHSQKDLKIRSFWPPNPIKFLSQIVNRLRKTNQYKFFTKIN
jgi:hypothetical protein